MIRRRRSLKRSRTEDNLAMLESSGRGGLDSDGRSSQLSMHYADDDGVSEGIGYDSDTQLGTRRRKSGARGFVALDCPRTTCPR